MSKKNFYVIVRKNKDTQQLESCKLPLYWLKADAVKKSKQLFGTQIVKISTEIIDRELNK